MNTIQYFEAVARHSRVNIAAEELSVSPSAVSQQIKSLEEQLGVLLFRRVKRRLVLTEEGERLYASATEALKLLRDAQMRVSRTREYRRLVIRVAASFGVRWLGRRVADFVTTNPGIELHVDATSSLTDFEKENIDLEIRYGLTPPAGFHNQSLIEDRVLPMCTPKLAATAVETGLAGFLDSTTLIHTVKAAVTWRHWLDQNNFTSIEDGYGLRFDRSSMSLQAAMDGIGVVLETATLAMDELRSGALVPLAPNLGTIDFPTYWLICPPRHLNRRAVKTYREWIETQASAHELEKKRLLQSLGCGDGHPYSVG
jgi:LysR family glycine cleavage system transcriptional activator